MKLLAVTTLYYPPAAVADNIASYAGSADGIFLWDNTPGGSQLELPKHARQKIVRMRHGINVGIAAALNEAVRMAVENGYTHLLTMDQDSAFVADSFTEYKKCVAVLTSDDSRPTAYTPFINRLPSDLPPCEVTSFITSGTIFPVSTLLKLGLFDEQLLIDGIDLEYSFRIRRAGGRILQIPSASMQHELGHPIRGRFLWWRPVSLNYPPMRVYYIARNFLYLCRAYPGYMNVKVMRKLVWQRPLYIIFMERDKLSKLKAWLRGVWHGYKLPTSPVNYLSVKESDMKKDTNIMHHDDNGRM